MSKMSKQAAQQPSGEGNNMNGRLDARMHSPDNRGLKSTVASESMRKNVKGGK